MHRRAHPSSGRLRASTHRHPSRPACASTGAPSMPRQSAS